MEWSATSAELAASEREVDELIVSQKELCQSIKELCHHISAFLAEHHSEPEAGSESLGAPSRSYSESSRRGIDGETVLYPDHYPEIRSDANCPPPYHRGHSETFHPNYRSNSREVLHSDPAPAARPRYQKSRSPERRSDETYRPDYRSRSRSRDRYPARDRSQEPPRQELPEPKYEGESRFRIRGCGLEKGRNGIDREGRDREDIRSRDEGGHAVIRYVDGLEYANEPYKSNGGERINGERIRGIASKANETTPQKLSRPTQFPSHQLPLESPPLSAPSCATLSAPSRAPLNGPFSISSCVTRGVAVSATIGSEISPTSDRNSELEHNTPYSGRNADFTSATCDVQFETAAELTYHKHKEHQDVNQTVPEKDITPPPGPPIKQVCSHCNKKLFSRERLFQHLRECDQARAALDHTESSSEILDDAEDASSRSHVSADSIPARRSVSIDFELPRRRRPRGKGRDRGRGSRGRERERRRR
ncbi:hypothetical protein GGR50DRAFT_243745 [Xylaria sp. CBS 124048]|nr:hypothetical protein GGR50DRAFT_243745 [Xylaria sp. CBS 124048]